MQSQTSLDSHSPGLGTKGNPTAWPAGQGCWVVWATEQGTAPTSLLAAIRRPRAAAAVLCRCECRRYQRWMVTAARFTCWMNLWAQGGGVSTAPGAAEHRQLPHSSRSCRCTESGLSPRVKSHRTRTNCPRAPRTSWHHQPAPSLTSQPPPRSPPSSGERCCHCCCCCCCCCGS